MKKSIYFDRFDQVGWPRLSDLEPYFLTESGMRQFFQLGNDNWGLNIEGVDGTERFPVGKGRVDINLIIQGHPKVGVLLQYRKTGAGISHVLYSKGDISRLYEKVVTMSGDRMPAGLFVPFEEAWKGIKSFMESDGSVPQTIMWLDAREIPKSVWYNSPV